MLRFLAVRAAWVAALLVAVVAAFVLRDAVRPGPDDGRRTPTARDDAAPTTTEVVIVPGPGQAFITGSASVVEGTADDAPLLATPLTLTVDQAAATSNVGADITGAIVDGKRVTIHWDGGRPLPLTADPGATAGAATGIDVGGASFNAGPAAVLWKLEGAPRALAAGTYHIDTTVAVGTKGLGAPQDGVTFTADGQTALNAKGAVTADGPRRILSMKGPGSLTFTGNLGVQTPDENKRVTTLHFGPGPFELTLTPGPTDYIVSATLQGPLS